jgi:hypothetical protein
MNPDRNSEQACSTSGIALELPPRMLHKYSTPSCTAMDIFVSFLVDSYLKCIHMINYLSPSQ